jgi:hypothetical protein
MACNDPIFQFYPGVPAGSTLRVRVEGNPDEFFTFGSVRVETPVPAPKQPVSHNQLHPGPFVIPVTQLVAVSVNVQFTVTTSASARVRAEVVGPNGKTFGQPYCREFTGTHGQTFSAVIGASV